MRGYLLNDAPENIKILVDTKSPKLWGYMHSTLPIVFSIYTVSNELLQTFTKSCIDALE